MKYNFDEIIPRENTDSLKYDFRSEYFGNSDVLPMWVADMDFRTPPFIIEAIKKRTEHEILGYSLKPKHFNASIIEWNNKRFGWKIKSDWLSYTPGIVPALSFASLAFSHQGDKIMIMTPVYHPFIFTVEKTGRQLVNCPLIDVGGQYEMDFDAIEKALKDPRLKMVYFCSPHNPVGKVWQKEELLKFANLCVENEIIIISDEIHADLTLGKNKHIPTASLSPEIADKTVTFMAPSKTFNIAGLCVSYSVISNLKLKHEFDTVIDNLHLAINIYGVVALEAAYTHGEEWVDQLVEYLGNNYIFLNEFIEENIPDIKVYPLDGTYLAWLDFRKLGDAEYTRKLLVEKAKLGLNDGRTFGEGGEGFHRINLACTQTTLEMALMQLKKAVVG